VSQVSLRRAFTQEDFDRFAALSGDDNPIHVDPDFSARTRFGRTVAHGVLLITVLTGLVERLRPGAAITAQDVRFPAPTFAGEEMEFRVWEEEGGVAFAVKRIADAIVTCDGSFSLPPRGGKGGDGGEPTGPDERAQTGAGAHPRSSPHQSALTPTQPSPLEGEGLTRVFSAADVDALVALNGASQPDGSVPIPLIGGLFSYLLGVKLPGRGTNYLKQQTRYLRPAPVGEALTARVAVTRRRPDKRLIDLSTTCRDGAGSLICEGRALVHAGDVAGAFD
jgi:acyl dehydratase